MEHEYPSSGFVSAPELPPFDEDLIDPSDCGSDIESDTNSLQGMYDRLIPGEHSTGNDPMVFAFSDGRTASFNRSESSNQGSLTSIDTTFQLNQKNFIYAHMTEKQFTWEIITIVVLLLGYAGKYFNSAHFYLIAESLEPQVNLPIPQLKLICGVVIILCFISKILLGILCDRYGLAKEIFIITNIVCAVSSCVFAFGNSSGWWIFSSLILSMSIPGTWVSLVGILARWIPVCRQGRIFSIFSSLFFLSNIISFVVVEAAIMGGNWRVYLFLVAAICIVCTIPALLFLKASPKRVSLQEPPTLKSTIRPKTFSDLFSPVFKKKQLWLLSLLALEIYGVCQFFLVYTWKYALNCYCKDTELNSQAYHECMESTDSFYVAIGVSLLFPFFGIISSFTVGYLKDGLTRKNRSVLLLPFLCAFFIFLVVMHIVIDNSSVFIAIIFVSCCGLTLLGPYSLLSGALSVDVGGKYRSSTVTGIVDGFGFISESTVIAISFFYGSDSQQTYILLCSLTAAAIITSILLWIVDYRKKRKKTNPWLDKFYEETNPDEHVYILAAPYRSVQYSSSDSYD